MWLRSHIAVAVARPATAAPTQPLAWELPYATGEALKKQNKKQTNKNTERDVYRKYELIESLEY